MDDRFPETIEDGELELLLKELRLTGEDPVWGAIPSKPGDEDRVLRFRDRNARLYRREGGMWVKKPRETLGLLIADTIREKLVEPSILGRLMQDVGVDVDVKMIDTLEEK